MSMENQRLRALLKLLDPHTDSYDLVIRKEIAAAIQENPQSVQTALEEEFPQHTPTHILQTL